MTISEGAMASESPSSGDSESDVAVGLPFAIVPLVDDGLSKLEVAPFPKMVVFMSLQLTVRSLRGQEACILSTSMNSKL